MKANIRVSKNVTLEIDGSKQKDLFKSICSAHEVFGETKCGLCQSENIVPVWRTAIKMTGKKQEVVDYPEYQCKDCFAKLALGTIHDDTGTLFPKRKLFNGQNPKNDDEREKATYGKHNGWFKFVKEEKAD